MNRRCAVSRLLVLSLLAVAPGGCATLGQIRALQRVDFSLDGVSGVRLAGIDVASVRSFSDLAFTDVARLADALRQGDLPLALDVRVLAENPDDNVADARLVEMDWTLLIEDRETVSGRFDREIVLPRGQPTGFPITVELNLIDFYEGSAGDLYEIARSLAGVGGASREVALEAFPVVRTAIGPIRYPGPIRIGTRVGG